MKTPERLQEMYARMLERLGPQNWWPAETPFEVMVGAILTQNTNWRNVERAIANLKDVNLLSFAAMAALPSGLLAEYIRPAGYYNIKARRLGNLLACIRERYGGDLEDFLGQPLPQLREQLLAVKGIGPETADSILLYAANHPVFVVDTYTHRILSRHHLIDAECGYMRFRNCSWIIWKRIHACTTSTMPCWYGWETGTVKRRILIVTGAPCGACEILPAVWIPEQGGCFPVRFPVPALAIMPEQLAADAPDHAGFLFLSCMRPKN
jgi:endonuclease III related protein